MKAMELEAFVNDVEGWGEVSLVEFNLIIERANNTMREVREDKIVVCYYDDDEPIAIATIYTK